MGRCRALSGLVQALSVSLRKISCSVPKGPRMTLSLQKDLQSPGPSESPKGDGRGQGWELDLRVSQGGPKAGPSPPPEDGIRTRASLES